MRQQDLSNSSVIVLANTIIATHEQEEGERMKLETEPIKSFRGRTRHEYKPKKAFRRNGEPSKINPLA